MKEKAYIPSNRNIMSPFSVSKGPFATPSFSVAASNTSSLTVCSSTSTSSTKKRKSESDSIMEEFNMEHNDPNKVMKMTLGVNTNSKKRYKGFQSPNKGLVIYLKRQAIHLALKADYEQKNKDKFSYNQYNKMNAQKLSKIAVMINTSIPGKIKMDPHGDYSWLKGVGDAFSYLIHSYFLVSEE